MIKSNEIKHLLHCNTLANPRRFEDMFNDDNTNSVIKQQNRFHEYADLFKTPYTDYIPERNIERFEDAISSDNTNIIEQRINRFNNYSDTYSGLVKLDDSIPPNPFDLYTDDDNMNHGNTLTNDFSETPLSKAFFSKENVERLQILIRHTVWLQSDKKYVIGTQSKLQLEIIMRSIFLQYSKNLSCQLLNQIESLNHRVLQYAVPRIMTAVEQYIIYRKDITTLPSVMDYPTNQSIAGDKSLENKAWF